MNNQREEIDLLIKQFEAIDIADAVIGTSKKKLLSNLITKAEAQSAIKTAEDAKKYFTDAYIKPPVISSVDDRIKLRKYFNSIIDRNRKILGG